MPFSTGNYAQFNDTGFEIGSNQLVAISEIFAGVHAYNGINNYDIDLNMDVTMDGSVVDSVEWKPTPAENTEEVRNIAPEEKGSTDKTKVDPIEIPEKPDVDNGTKSIPNAQYTDGDWGFDKLSGTNNARIVRYNGTGGNIVVPATVTADGNTYTVTEFGKNTSNYYNVFDNTTLQANSTLQFSSGIVEIAKYCCYNITNLTGTITLPSSVTLVGDFAFKGSGITGVDFSNSVQVRVENAAFANCDGLTTLSIPNTVNLISSPFSTCTNLTTIYCDTDIPYYGFSASGTNATLTLGNNVKTIGSYGFYQASISAINFGTGLETIKEMAFSEGYKGSTLTLPNSLVTIEKGGFSVNPSITTINFGNSLKEIGAMTGVSGPYSGGFSQSSVTSITLPDSLEILGAYTFCGCQYLSSITLNNGLKMIGGSCFAKNNNDFPATIITSITLPNSLEEIGGSAFRYVTTLTSITIPDGVIVGASCFNNCSGLTSLTLGEGVSLKQNAFADCPNLTGTLNIRDNTKFLGEQVFRGAGFTGLTLGNGITFDSSAIYVFTGCTSITGTVTIPSDWEYIPDGLFGQCSGITKIIMHDGIESIGAGAFSRCTGATEINIPKNVKSIGNSAFTNVRITGDLILPDGLETIGEQAFSSSRYNGTIIIPASVNEIGSKAFLNMSYVLRLINLSDVTPGTNAFGQTSNLKNVLNLGDVEYTTTSYGLNATTVKDQLAATNYIAPADITVTEQKEGAIWSMLAVVPIFMAMLLVVGVVGLVIWKR